MNENAKKWVEALRSGKYKQGRGGLRQDDKFCCLGVACDVYHASGNNLNISTVVNVDDEDEPRTSEEFFMYDGEGAVLPLKVAVWLNLSTVTGAMDGKDLSLVCLNDNGADFNRIAEVIESEPEGLFRSKDE